VRSTTTRKGLGWIHQQARKRALAAMPEGQPCARCGRPMYHAQQLDLDHFPGRMFGGTQEMRLSHARCNRRAGGRIGGRIRPRSRKFRTSRAW
jgi:hypothetical protein